MAWLCRSLALSHSYPTTTTQGILFTFAEQPGTWEGAVNVVINAQYSLILPRKKAISRSSH